MFEILARAAPLSSADLQEALARCLRADGKFVPRLALFAGELELPFDELAALRATLTTVAPLAGQDEVLKSATAAAKELLAIPGLMSAPAVAEGLTKRLEDAFAQGKRVVAAGYLEAQRERALLSQRAYQRRAVLGGPHLRALLRLGGTELDAPSKHGAPSKIHVAVVPAYVTAAVADLLPMFPRFRARVVAEIRLAVDRYETHPTALKILALGRVASADLPPARPSDRGVLRDAGAPGQRDPSRQGPMVVAGPAIEASILLLTEDGAESAYETMQAVARRMLVLVDPRARTHLVAFEKIADLVEFLKTHVVPAQRT